MRLGIADHFGWAVAVTASADHDVVDRRRIELVEPGVCAAPIHYEGKNLDATGAAALVATVRASVVRATAAALDELAAAAHTRNWGVHLYDAKHIESQAAGVLGESSDEFLQRPRAALGPPWTKDHRVALAAAIVAG